MKRDYYSNDINKFCESNPDVILGELSKHSTFDIEQNQRDAWLSEISILKEILKKYDGKIYFEYSIPRMGKRIDVVLIIEHIIFVLEFKVGEEEFPSYAIDQVYDYALDLKNFHETSHDKYIAPILISTKARSPFLEIGLTHHNDHVFEPIKSSLDQLNGAIDQVLSYDDSENIITDYWEEGRYCPTPTIIEAAIALYQDHHVEEILQKDASKKNLSKTTDAISEIIKETKKGSKKSICFITGVPGAGKTLVGLDVATKNIDRDSENYSVYLSGNDPLVKVLREALVKDKYFREKQNGNKIKKGEIRSEVKTFIQNVHNFRDECLKDISRPPIEHVALFDEAQRAWNKDKTIDFMKRKKNKPDFDYSEPEFLISCLDRHDDWAVIVCLVGGGQEIHSGEAGISEWIESLIRSYPDWDIYISSKLTDSEYGAGRILDEVSERKDVFFDDDLHLSVSMRSFRAENVSLLVKQMLDLNINEARNTLLKLNKKYPIVITRDINKAKEWLRKQARGSERYGIVVSSQAERLKPYAIDVKSKINEIHWFLDGKDDVRSSYYLESVATEFQIQGLELDWVCVTWDADFRYSKNGWENWEFRGSKWNHIKKNERKEYQKNAYRVLLTRARQGMVIVVPPGDEQDPTRKKEYYDPSYEYLRTLGFIEL